MSKTTKYILREVGIIIILLMVACWYRDYRSTHETIEIEVPEVGDEVRG